MKRIAIACALLLAACSADPDEAAKAQSVTAADDAGVADGGEPVPPPDPTAESPIQYVDASAD